MSTIYRQRVEAGEPGEGVVFNVPGSTPPGALAWGIDICDGWKTSPDITVNSTELGALRDGMDYGDYFPMRQRFVTVGGYAYAASAETAEALHDILVRDAFPRNKDQMLIRFETTPKYVTYRRVGPVETEWTVETGFRWSTVLGCPDPLKYGTSVQVQGAGTAGQSTSGVSFPITFPFHFTGIAGGADDTTAAILNEGTANSPHVIADITGPLPRGGWRLRNDSNDGELFFDVGLSAGETMQIDFAQQLLTVNGFPFAARRTGDFWTLQPGSNAIRLYTDFDPATTVLITAESAWE